MLLCADYVQDADAFVGRVGGGLHEIRAASAPALVRSPVCALLLVAPCFLLLYATKQQNEQNGIPASESRVHEF